ncbi:hypothetical protein ALQ00_05260 [Pseudomonas syringae pv. tomato]|nr:hypothetical protein ALQ00_05260 [Pseudomonas syringae pv. tomato]RMT35455.1 hypothetical protein ALP50_05726 [Pseudomonas syringae pv. spinaceae]
MPEYKSLNFLTIFLSADFTCWKINSGATACQQTAQ